MSAMTSNFGGKKAAPFRSGGKRRAAKAVMASAKRKKREMALSVVTGREIDLGKNGSQWKHGWIPLNAAAVALKAHHSKGGSGVSDPADHMGKIREHIVSARKELNARSAPGESSRQTPIHLGPEGKGSITVHSKGDSHVYHVSAETTDGGKMTKQTDSAEKAAVVLHREIYGAPKDNSEKTAWRAGSPLTENVKTLGDVGMVAKMHGKDSPEFQSAVSLKKAFDAEGMARDTYGHGSKQHEAARSKRMGIEAEIKKSDPGYTTGTGRSKPSIQNHSQMSNQDKIDAAETMHGTGSKQHLTALAKFGTESQKRAATSKLKAFKDAAMTAKLDVVAKKHGFKSYAAYRDYIAKNYGGDFTPRSGVGKSLERWPGVTVEHGVNGIRVRMGATGEAGKQRARETLARLRKDGHQGRLVGITKGGIRHYAVVVDKEA